MKKTRISTVSARVSGSRRISHPSCPKCGHRQSIKSGLVQGEQRWKCKSCAYQFTRVTPRGRPVWQKSLAVLLYSHGMSMHNIARIFHIQPSTVLKWVRQYSNSRQAASGSNVYTMDMTEMQRHLKHNKEQSPVLCIAIDDALLKKSMGIVITSR